MFDNLSTRLGAVFDRLRGRGALTEEDVDEAMREVRVALLEADVALPVVKDFIGRRRERAVGEEVIRERHARPGGRKIVYDGLVEMLGGDERATLSLGAPARRDPDGRPAGLGQDHHGRQAGAAAAARERKKVLLASLDTRRPAAMEQLEVLARQAEVDSLPIVAGQSAARHRPPRARDRASARATTS